MQNWFMDVSAAFRGLARHKGFVAIALVTLSLGIGANTAIVSAARGVLSRPLPYPESDRLVHIWAFWPGGSGNLSFPDGVAITQTSRTIEASAVYQAYGSVALTGRVPALNLNPTFVTPEYFRLLGARPRLGRLFADADDAQGAAGQVAVLSASAWIREFGADPRIVGRTLHLNGLPFEVVGVMNEGFADLGAVEGPSPDIFLPTAATTNLMSQPLRTDTLRLYWGLGRLKPGVSIDQAREDLTAIAARMEQERPSSHKGYGLEVRSLSDHIRGGYRAPAILLLSGSLLVLLVGCANVVNLLLVRLAEREREMSLRAALGASSTRLFSQAFIESAVIASLGGLLGTALGLVLSRMVSVWVATHVSRFVDVSLDPVALGMALLLTATCVLAIGLIPALGSRGFELRGRLAEGSRSAIAGSGGPLRRFFMGGSVALALVLFAAAGLMVRSYQELNATSIGLRTDNLLTFRMDLSGPRYQEAPARVQLVEQFLERVNALPGVTSATVLGPSMLGRATWVVNVAPEGRPIDQPDAFTMLFRHSVATEGLQGLGIERVSGRDITPRDTAEAPLVALVSESVARQLWPGEDPLGRRLLRSAPGLPPIEVVGVVKDVRHRERFSFEDARVGVIGGIGPQRDIYFPYAQRPNSGVTFAVRVSGDAAIVNSVRKAAASLDPDLPVSDPRFLEDRLRDQERLPRALAGLLVASALVAALLAAIGIYGVIAHSVGRRTREIGLRVALGASRRAIVRLVVEQGLWPVLLGFVAGLAGSVGLGRFAGAILYRVKPDDPVTFAFVSLSLLGIAVLAAVIPTRRALAVDPNVALRSE